MRVQVLQHVPFEGIGSIDAWLSSRGAAVGYTRFFEPSPALPDVRGLDLAIVMGGPMSVNDEAALPWLVAEKAFVRDAIRAGVAMVGVCLGAQLIASALGARVFPNRQREIGWFELRGEAGDDTFRFPERFMAFHWHGETFDLPPGARRLASSVACENQAFQLGSNVVGVQFHLETTPDSLDAIASACRNELVEARFVQSEATIRAAQPEAYAEINALMSELLGYVTRDDVTRAAPATRGGRA